MTLEERLGLFDIANLKRLFEAFGIGIEREALRVSKQGVLSQKKHPAALGSPLTNASISLDFCEPQVEMISPVFRSTDRIVEYLNNLVAFIYRNLDDEILWSTSMPCAIEDPGLIHEASFGNSNEARLKELYRVGLASRYGKIMQTISGIHLNYSFHDELFETLQAMQSSQLGFIEFRTETYLGLMRNVLRHCWLLIYLFGASPSAHRSFLQNDRHHGIELAEETATGPLACSLRMSDAGYVNRTRCKSNISYNSLEAMMADLKKAITTSCADFSLIEGEGRQLNTNIMQIENEHYSFIRGKNDQAGKLRPLAALHRFGINYVELRCIDIDIENMAGISKESIDFYRLFLLYCLLTDSPPIDSDEDENNSENANMAALYGHSEAFAIRKGRKKVTKADAARPIFNDLKLLASALDLGLSENYYSRLVAENEAKIEDPGLTPSRQAMKAIEEPGFTGWALQHSLKMASEVRQFETSDELQRQLAGQAKQSLVDLKKVEQGSTGDFKAFWKNFTEQIS